MSEKKATKGRPGSAGGRKGKFERYFANTERNKERNVRRRNGALALKAWKEARWTKRRVA